MQRLEFDSVLYKKDAVKQAITDYQDLAEIHFQDFSSKYICEVSQTKYDLDETCLEFSNYVLELTITMGDKYHGLR